MTDTTERAAPAPTGGTATTGLELVTAQPAEARQFYSWLLSLDGSHGRPSSADDLAHRGISRIVGTSAEIGGPGWIPHIRLADLDGALGRADGLGFTHGPTIEVDGRETHYLADRHGVRCALSDGVGHDPVPPGSTTFVSDYWALDVAETLADFAALLGTDVIAVANDPLSYHLLHDGERPVMGILEFGPGPGLPNWFPYLRVDDVERSIRLALAAGSRLRVPLSLTPVDRSGVLEDPFGTLVCLSTVLRPDEDGRRPHPDGREALARIRAILS